MSDKEDRDAIYGDFNDAVNMSPSEIEAWLDKDDSKRVGWKGEDGQGSAESVGHQSGRRIVAIKRKAKADLSADDLAHMKKVVGYVARHKAQGPAKDKATSDWRYSLMNWGHDPTK